jgi:hypothetical protein
MLMLEARAGPPTPPATVVTVHPAEASGGAARCTPARANSRPTVGMTHRAADVGQRAHDLAGMFAGAFEDDGEVAHSERPVAESLSEDEYVLGRDAPRVVRERAIRHTLATIALMNRLHPYPGLPRSRKIRAVWQ